MVLHCFSVIALKIIMNTRYSLFGHSNFRRVAKQNYSYAVVQKGKSDGNF